MTHAFIQTALSNICTVIISIFSTLYFFQCFFEKKKSNRWVNACVLMSMSLAFWCTLQFIESRSLNVIILLACTYFISLRFAMKWYNGILFTLLFFAISSICEVVVALLTVLLYKIEYADLREGVFLFSGMLLSKFVAFTLFAILRFKKHHILFGKHKQSWFILFLLPTATILVALGQINYMRFQSVQNSSNIITLISMIFLILCNHYVFRFIDTIWQSAETDQKLVVADNLLLEQERQYSIVVNNHHEIAKIHHDYKNMLLGLQSDLICGRYDEAMKHIQSELSLVSLSNSIISGNQIIDTIVNTKMNTAKDFGIVIDFQFRNIQNLFIDSIDLAILLGNALDNAIEATCNLLDNSRKTITLLIVQKDNILNIIVKNPVEKDVDVDHLETIKKDNRFHGYGIINMRTIVNRYDGSILFTCHNLSFGTTILLPNRNLTPVNYE